MLQQLDEFPLHQAPAPLDQPYTSDRNFYDRYYFCAHDRTGDVFLSAGWGLYPNLGVMDGFVTIAVDGRQHTIRYSDALSPDRMSPTVGPMRIEILQPMQQLRVVVDDPDQPIGCDLTWDGAFPVLAEQPHVMRRGHKVILDAARYTQVGSWSGTIRLGDRTWNVDPATWTGTRDRSWGIRPVGEAEPSGRTDAEIAEDWGMWWMYTPLRFDDLSMLIVVQEESDGYRVHNDAVMAGPDGVPQQMGWPRATIEYIPGTRLPVAATVALTDPQGRPMTLSVKCHGFIALNAGPGYGTDPEWTHGQWRGRDWSLYSEVDMADDAVTSMLPFATIDHIAEAELTDGEGNVHHGWGMFEHMIIGAHKPTGFGSLFDVAT